MKEEWKVIAEFPRYCISNYGRVKSMVGKNEIILQPNIIKGYEYVKLYRVNKDKINELKLLRIHRIVAQYFCDNYSCEVDVHHIDKNTRNNRADNLICLTKEQHINIHKNTNKLTAERNKDVSTELENNIH